MTVSSVMDIRFGRTLPVVAAALATVGCSAHRSSFGDDADTICERAIAAAATMARTGPTGDSRSDAFRRFIERRASALTDLHGLTPPPENAEGVARMLAYFDQSQRLLREATRVSGERSVGIVIAAAAEGRKGQAVARRLGLDDCAHF